jgi:hypothetical protein
LSAINLTAWLAVLPRRRPADARTARSVYTLEETAAKLGVTTQERLHVC